MTRVWKILLGAYLGISLIGTLVAAQLENNSTLTSSSAISSPPGLDDYESVEVSWLSSEDASNHLCTEFYVCVPLQFFLPEACGLVEFRYLILDPESQEAIASAYSYFSFPEVGTNFAEVGLNNLISEQVLVSLPSAVCLDSLSFAPPSSSGLYNLPSKFCSQTGKAYCRSTSISAQQLLYEQGEPWTGSGSYGGYAIRCKDGWISYSGGKQGACSSHGGIDR